MASRKSVPTTARRRLQSLAQAKDVQKHENELPRINYLAAYKALLSALMRRQLGEKDDGEKTLPTSEEHHN